MKLFFIRINCLLRMLRKGTGPSRRTLKLRKTKYFIIAKEHIFQTFIKFHSRKTGGKRKTRKPLCSQRSSTSGNITLHFIGELSISGAKPFATNRTEF